MITKGQLILAADCLLLLVLLRILPVEPKVAVGLSLLVFIGILWLTEAIHIALTALLVPILAVLFHVYDVKAAMSHFSTPVIYQFLGGFALATALQKQGLDKAMAAKVLMWSRGNMRPAVLMLFAVTAGLSMWVSNTVTTCVMLPLVLGILKEVDVKQEQNTYLFVLLGLAYSASIGGIATLIGSPPNAIAAAEVGLDFRGWLAFGLPVSLVLLPTVIALLWCLFRPNLNHRFTFSSVKIAWDKGKLTALLVFAVIVLLWLFSRPISQWLGGIRYFDALVGVIAVMLVCVSGAAEWRDVQRQTDWGILVLFGGGICLSAILQETGATQFLAWKISAGFSVVPRYVVFLGVTLFVVFLTEFASNMATAALLVPVFATVAEQLPLSPIVISVLVGVACSCAFMLPAATAPNALVYGTGYVPAGRMLKAGFVLNGVSAVVLGSLAYLFWG